MSDENTSLVPAANSAALAERDPYAPANLSEAMRLADMIARSDLAPKDYKGKPGNVLIAMKMGHELGLSSMQAVQNIAVINGRPSVWGDAMLALCQAHADFEDIIETDDGQTATCTVKRRGRSPTTRTFSMEDAKRAGLLGKQGPWTNYPARMRQMRARGFALRDAFADALRGLSSAEEQQDVVHAQVVHDEPRGEAPATQRVLQRLEAKSPAVDVLARLRDARDEAQLKAAAEAAKKLAPAQQEEARALYKTRLQQIREEEWRARQVAREQEPAHDPVTGEVHESKWDDVGGEPMSSDEVPEEMQDEAKPIEHRPQSAPYRLRPQRNK